MLGNFSKLLVGVVLGFQLIGCANMGSNQQVGSVTGGIVGGLLGSNIGGGHGRTAAIIGGSIIGSMIGGNVGESMDQANRIKVAHALETTRLNHSRSWVDAHTGYRYTVVPIKTYHAHGRLCRHYKTSILVNGNLETAKGKACKDEHGDWVIVK